MNYPPVSLVIEQAPQQAGGEVLMLRRCIVLDAEGAPIGELPIIGFVQSCEATSPATTTLRTYRARVEVVE